MTRLNKFLPGDRIVLVYPSVGANRHLATVTEVSAISISVRIMASCGRSRFLLAQAPLVQRPRPRGLDRADYFTNSGAQSR
jgi:hypothetical protein